MEEIISIKPTSDRVVVRMKNDDGKSDGGIYVPDSSKGEDAMADVVAVGPGKNINEPLNIFVGEVVLYRRGSGVKVKINGDDLLVLREVDIFCSLVKKG